MSILLVAGLGNPGRAYEETRHNVGFLVVDALAAHLRATWKTVASFEAAVARVDLSDGRTLLLAKPQTFMNESGRALQRIAGFYKVPATAMLAVYDDLTIDVGLVKVTVSGSAGGHNGVASLLEHLGNGFVRYRIGIGPRTPPEMDLKDFVLGKFTPEQKLIIDQSLERYTSGLRLVIDQGADRAMNQLNRRDLP